MDSSSVNILVQARGTLTADGGSLFLRTHQLQPIGWSRSTALKTSYRQMPTLIASETNSQSRR